MNPFIMLPFPFIEEGMGKNDFNKTWKYIKNDIIRKGWVVWDSLLNNNNKSNTFVLI